MGAKGTGIIFGGGVYVAENTSREASVELAAKWRTTEAQSVAPVSIGRWEPTKCRMHFVGEEEQRND